MKYAVIGDTVNVAARIQALNARLGTTMLASGEVHARLPEELATLAVAHGEHVVKGRDRAVVAYAF
jgi:class 3 adenylate cyclase